MIARPATIFTARPKVFERHVVEQNSVGGERERLLKLGQRVDFHFDLDQMTCADAGSLDCSAHPACDCDVVVLDQDGVVEAEAMVATAARAHGMFFQCAQTR